MRLFALILVVFSMGFSHGVRAEDEAVSKIYDKWRLIMDRSMPQVDAADMVLQSIVVLGVEKNKNLTCGDMRTMDVNKLASGIQAAREMTSATTQFIHALDEKDPDIKELQSIIQNLKTRKENYEENIKEIKKTKDILCGTS